jgi:hypothetical protein
MITGTVTGSLGPAKQKSEKKKEMKDTPAVKSNFPILAANQAKIDKLLLEVEAKFEKLRMSDILTDCSVL